MMARWGSVAAAWMAFVVLPTATSAFAERVPLPIPRPKESASAPRPSAPIPLAPSSPSTTATVGQPSVAPKPPVFIGKPGETIAFDAAQRAVADRISAYLSGIRVLSGEFVQIGPDGTKTTGDFYLQKPGRVRFDYNPPSPIELIADGSSVVVRDRVLATQDLYPLSQTPLRFILADQIDLLRDTNVVAIYSDNVFATIVVEEQHIIGGTHRLMMMFDAKTYQLKQWTVTDPQGYDTTIAVYNLDSTRRPDPNLFRIDYTRNIQ